MFFIANVASFGIEGDMFMMFSATSRIESTSASNSTLFFSGALSMSGVTLALKYGSVETYSPISIFSSPERITVRLPFGISRIFSMRAAVPMRYMSSGVGFSISLLRCSTAPNSPPSALTALTSAMLFSRPTVIGVIAPGNRTELRRVSIGSMFGTLTSSSGSSSPDTIGII